MKDIFVDIVDDQDEVIAVRPLSLVVEDGLLKQIRMVKLFIMNYDKELLLCRNAFAKKGDDLFDCPLTAIVHAGESYEEALIRSAQEIFGLNLSTMQYYELGKLSREDGVDNFTEVYELSYNELPDFSATKFNDFIWEKPLDIITQFAKNPEGEKSLSICLKSFYFDCQDNFSC
ncbi:MAG: hypothetical protein JO129_03140 [Candidatus Dependentiae bacterium]|nr:hypothetical protein [Candidatus Dependentiae bacterium]